MPITFPNTTITITMDASMEGWGGNCIVPRSGTSLFSDLWSVDKRQLHINVLEFRAVHLTLLHLEQDVLGQSILIESDNTVTVSYKNKQGGVVSKTLNDETYTLLQLLITRSITVRAIHRPGANELANFLSCNHSDSTEYHLSERVVRQLFQLWSTPQVDLFTSHLNHHLPLWFCWTGHPLAVASDALSKPWTGLPLVPLLKRTLVKIREDQANKVIVIAPSWPRRSWYPTFFPRWHVRSLSCSHAGGISCRNACLTRACSSTPI